MIYVLAILFAFAAAHCVLSMATTELPSKKPCHPKVIGTHDGKFHCDEVLACYLLRYVQYFIRVH